MNAKITYAIFVVVIGAIGIATLTLPFNTILSVDAASHCHSSGGSYGCNPGTPPVGADLSVTRQHAISYLIMIINFGAG